ncbi:hypothetical protein NMY22_g9800 [Coprinellus aureogranulatus]|nr:hypothetical protein NMY22_g9800 [Coprinellus aureogranulatus]
MLSTATATIGVVIVEVLAMESLLQLLNDDSDINGRQPGDDTSFQSFPLHLQETLTRKVPPKLNVRFQSSLYPTYKSTKPISFATKNFLSWLSTQSEGPVILVGHSMGGLLAADAATHHSNRNKDGKPKRIVGVIAFDVPFLGMHPHVVISGIASLFAKDEGKDGKTEKEMNRHPQIQVVDPHTANHSDSNVASGSDDWEKFKAKISGSSRPRSQVIDNGSLDVPRSPASLSTLSLPEPSSPHSASSSPSRRSPSPNFYDKAVGFLATHAKADDPVVRWLRKHADDPFSAGKRWIIERFQFGSCMFDPADLGIRYDALQDWNGLWVNYWTYVDAHKHDRKKKDGDAQPKGGETLSEADELDNDIALLDSGIYDRVTSKGGSSTAPAENSDSNNKKRSVLKKKRQESLDQSKSKPSLRHFVVLPTGLGKVLGGWEHWEKVPIAGVEDEVAAHTGLFIPEHNLDYAKFVDRVAGKVIGWCTQLYVK